MKIELCDICGRRFGNGVYRSLDIKIKTDPSKFGWKRMDICTSCANTICSLSRNNEIELPDLNKIGNDIRKSGCKLMLDFNGPANELFDKIDHLVSTGAISLRVVDPETKDFTQMSLDAYRDTAKW